MKCYFCQSDMLPAADEFSCPKCPHGVYLMLSHLFWIRFSLKNKKYQALWYFCVFNVKYDHPQLFRLYNDEGTYERIMELTSGIDKITPQNIIYKMNTYLPFI